MENPVKIIFLDFDGVLINRESLKKSSGYSAFAHPSCVYALNRIIKETGAHIVVSSTHRMGHSVDELITRLEKWGVKGTVLGKTPVHWHDPRGCEIFAFIKKWEEIDSEEIESFVILDDDADMLNLVGHLVRTDEDLGLTENDANEAIKHLSTPVDVKNLRLAQGACGHMPKTRYVDEYMWM